MGHRPQPWSGHDGALWQESSAWPTPTGSLREGQPSGRTLRSGIKIIRKFQDYVSNDPELSKNLPDNS